MVQLNFKKTPARSIIIEFLSNSKSPVDVEQIISFLRSKKLNTNKVTVYRIIELLLQNGIVERLEFGEGKFRYELKKKHHHHLVCQNCGKIQDVEIGVIEKLEKEIQKNKHFQVQSHSLEFFGLCENCQK
ncbi:MAG TPA: transcriptional repressor [Patescibacteria group bacterium]|jgi:Fur family ferric uptake transcriptional regulator|nr:transcriptional repressor [Patescibacteria group bacterium]